jgi:hypothetical protein
MPKRPTDDDGWGDPDETSEAPETSETSEAAEPSAAAEPAEPKEPGETSPAAPPSVEIESGWIEAPGAEAPAGATKAPPDAAAKDDLGAPATAAAGPPRAEESESQPPPPSSLPEAAGIREPPRPWRPRLSRRGWLMAIAAALATVAIGTGAVLAWLNSRHFYLECGDDEIRASRGRSWPWGRTTMEGARWKPVPVAGRIECQSARFASEAALEAAFLEAVHARADALLARDELGDAAQIETAANLIEQGLVLSRSPEHRDARKELERLRGDVEYWRATSEVQSALAAIEAARARFADAAGHAPRHVRDADRWAGFLEQLLKRGRSGPGAFAAERARPEAASDLAPAGGDGETAPRATAPDELPDPDAEPAKPAAPAPIPRGGVLL